MNENQAPLERLNYYNGQRLQAGDFRLEQDYHIRVRRMLNSSLHTYGIAAGLEVFVKEGDPHTLVITPGLALDAEGREIILMEPEEILAMGIPSETEGVVFGNYLTIRYHEMAVSHQGQECAAGGNGKKHKIAWGGPARVRAEPQIEWQNSWPDETSGRVVLAQIELDENCAVRDIRLGVRRYVGLSQPARSLAYALEGEKDIDANNSKVLYFHIRGGRPEAVTLYLRGAQFSGLYYSEMGEHSHSLSGSTATGGTIPSHTHNLSLGTLSTQEAGNHRHEVWSDTDDAQQGAMEVGKRDLVDQRLTGAGGVKGGRGNMEVKLSGAHTHTISSSGGSVSPAGALPGHSHSLSGDTGPAGMTIPVRSGAGYSYLEDLQVWIDDTDYTSDIKTRLNWDRLGDGSQGHSLQSGTGPIALDTLGPDLTEGEHKIELRVGSGGGRVIYNLYVE
jgi:hypothetical protein